MFTFWDRLGTKKVKRIRVKKPDEVKEQVKNLLQKENQGLILMVRE